MTNGRTLWDAAGGQACIQAMATAFFQAAKADPLLGPLFRQASPDHARYLAGWFAVIFGGPPDYLRDRGGLPFVIWQHAGMKISDAQRARWVMLMRQAAKQADMPDDVRPTYDRYISTISGYVQANSHMDRDQLETLLGPYPTGG